MNELKYDEELEKAAKKQKHTCFIYGVEEIIKNEMYSTHDAAYHPRATKVACIEYYCSNSKSNMKFFVIDKGPGGEKTGEPGSKYPSGRSKEADSGLCVVSSGFGVSKNIVLAVLIVVLNFI
ncbi:hypothetical protein B9Z55_007478 [Caenorhabditis nigoni]|nr:hypothetical protein B9Z55_007478 [Caenorhabditis nigoni]